MKFFWRNFDPSSLKVRLTLGIAIVSVSSLGGLAIWTSMRMQQILVATHKEDIKYIADRFTDDVEIYYDMVSLEEAMQRAVENLSGNNKVLWVKNNSSQITAKSLALNNRAIADILLPLKNIPPIPQVQDLEGRYWLLCASPLQIDNTNLGKLYIAQDITEDQTMLISLIRSLSIATLITISIMTGVIAIYIDRSIQPLKRISQVTSNISAEKLDQAQLDFNNAPREVKELAETFDKMLKRLSESWSHQRELLSNVSHELRTPLTIISGYLQSTLRRGKNLTEIQREALTTANSEADRTVQLLRELLDLARADSGGMHFQLEPIVVNDVLKEITEMAKQYGDRIIKLEFPPDAIVIKVDINRFKQIMLNLIDNAIKYSPAPNPITLKVTQDNNQAHIHVCDKGSGIPLTQQARIFERFYRLDEARNRAGGTGLGLSIVKTLVEGMSGNVSVRSQLGEGTTFTVCFPLA